MLITIKPQQNRSKFIKSTNSQNHHLANKVRPRATLNLNILWTISKLRLITTKHQAILAHLPMTTNISPVSKRANLKQVKVYQVIWVNRYLKATTHYQTEINNLKLTIHTVAIHPILIMALLFNLNVATTSSIRT